MEKWKETAPAKRETVVVEGETTLEEGKRENNGEFNMAPRGSFNHLIESPAYLGSPPRRLHLASSLSSSRIPPSKDRRLLKDEFARIPFLSLSSLVPSAFRRAVASPLSSAPAISGCKGASSSLDRYPRIGSRPANRINGDPRQQYSNTKALAKPSRVQGKHSTRSMAGTSM